MQILYAHFNEVNIGEFTKDSKGALSFKYNLNWIQSSQAFPVSLSIPLSRKTYYGDLVANYLENLLPNNQQVISKIVAKFDIKTNSPFDILSVIGKDCVGAIQLSTSQKPERTTIDVKRLSSGDIEALLKSVNNDAPMGMVNEVDDYEDDDNGFRLSLAGVQNKTALTLIDGVWCKPIGSTPTTHIFKLPIGEFGNSKLDLSESCENEWLCLKILSLAGFEVNKAEIKQFGEQKALVVERFDRIHYKGLIYRVPQEDMCQVLSIPSDLKYENQSSREESKPSILNITKILANSSNSKDKEIFFKIQVAFWILAAIDGHAKNFSIILGANNSFKLSPLYDVISAWPHIPKELPWQKAKMGMSLKTSTRRQYHLRKMDYRYFVLTGNEIGFTNAKSELLIDEVIRNISSAIDLVKLEVQDDFPEKIFDGIVNGTSRGIEIILDTRTAYFKQHGSYMDANVESNILEEGRSHR